MTYFSHLALLSQGDFAISTEHANHYLSGYFPTSVFFDAASEQEIIEIYRSANSANLASRNTLKRFKVASHFFLRLQWK